ncbi:MAG: 23S rRNA (guanosine(2251)-2'-O)-methyltransferase RlmB, partial [Halioglobus sp.]
QLSIPMRNGVESLNVAVTASLIAYGPHLER